MTIETPSAVLWDMDGTLIDSEPYWMASETALVESFGGVWTHEDCMQLVGSGLPTSAAILQSRGVDLGIDEIIDRMTDEVIAQLAVEIPWRPGARELLESLRAAGTPCGLVTMSISRMAAAVVERLPADSFQVVVTGDLVENSKPHPEPYLRAAEVLGVPIEACVAIEDSHAGLASAVAAGTVAIGVPHQLVLDEAQGYTVWPTLAGTTTTDVDALYTSVRALQPRNETLR